MTKIIILLFLLTFSAFGQNDSLVKRFPSAFESALNKNFSEEQFQTLDREYSELLSADSEVINPTTDPKQSDAKVYPLYDFKNSKLYQDNIDSLLLSSNPNQRLLSVMIVGASGDISREAILLDKLKTEEQYAGILISAGIALMELKTDHTTELFDFLVKYEEFGDAHMIPYFFGLNRDRLRQTAYERIGGKNEKEKILAAQTLAVTTPNTTTEQLLKKAVTDWDVKIKGYAIYSIKELRIGNLRDILKPLVDIPKLRGITVAALANSPTEQDVEYVLALVGKEKAISWEVLSGLLGSKNPKVIRYWLKCLYSKQLPADYVMYLYEQPLVKSDDILADLQKALRKITNPKILAQLVEGLRGRTDSQSIDIVISFLTHPDSSVRYFASSVTRDNPSNRLKEPSVRKLIERNLKN